VPLSVPTPPPPGGWSRPRPPNPPRATTVELPRPAAKAHPDLVALPVAFGTGPAVGNGEGGEGDTPPWEQTDTDRLTKALGLVRQGAAPQPRGSACERYFGTRLPSC